MSIDPAPNQAQGSAPMIGLAAADRCPSCGSDMTPDQRYCVECGSRRGKPRFSLEPKAPSGAAAAAPPTPPRQPRRLSPSVTLLTGLAVMLLAVWVGVSIGNHDSSDLTGKQPHYKVVINNSGGSSSGSSETSGTTKGATSSGSSRHSSGSSSKKSSSTSTTVSKKSAIDGNAGPKTDYKSLHGTKQRKAAEKKNLNTKVKLGNGKTLAPETQKVGSKCSDNEVGCQNGKYTQDYFGSGS